MLTTLLLIWFIAIPAALVTGRVITTRGRGASRTADRSVPTLGAALFPSPRTADVSASLQTLQTTETPRHRQSVAA